MTVISAQNIAYSIGAKDILSEVSFTIEEKEKVGIIGVNGAGKTTIFRMLTGEITPTAGSIAIKNGAVTGILRQEPALAENQTVYGAVETVFSSLKVLEERIKSAEEKLNAVTGSESPDDIQRLIDSHERLIADYTSRGGYEYEGKVRSALLSLGFAEESFSQYVHTLSGGQKTRLGLIKLFLTEPDILLLDEPTNHVDTDSLEWLESFLKSYPKTVVVISHDRFFLDAVTDKIIEVENGKAYSASGNYTAFLAKKAENRELMQKRFDNQQKEIKRIEDMIERLKRWGREKQLKTAHSKEKMLEKMDKAEKPENLPKKIALDFGSPKKKNDSTFNSGDDVLSVIDLGKSFPPKQLFTNLSFEVKRCDNLFIIGPNGCGKSTLLKILTDKLQADKGHFDYGYNVRLGYYDQENQDLTPENTVLDELWDDFTTLDQNEVRSILAKFLFRNEDVEKLVSALSGGEKARLTIAKLILQKANLLILDEPTNHLDINSREALESALNEFKGTIIAVSHDRYFIRKLATRVLEINQNVEGGSFLLNDGYDSYLEYKSKYLTDKVSDKPAKVISEDKLRRIADLEEKKARKKRGESLQREKRGIEADIAVNEKRAAQIDFIIADDEVVADYKKLAEAYEEKDKVERILEELYEKMFALEVTIEEFEKERLSRGE
ncbi:thiamine ABC transporter substrate-binding protein [Clostridia bacterium]|nr:thiamine ABC transporter substrate-binding protein [Clostridia bacterium]